MTTRPYLLEQIDDAAVVQYYADGFSSLPLETKILTWHLYQAALAGRDIFYDQRYRHGLRMRRVLEQILVHAPASRADLADVLFEVRRYTKLFWINSGPYDGYTARKFVLRCDRARFRELADVAAAAGARFPVGEGQSLGALLDQLDGPFFDPAMDPMVTSKSPREGADILEASANNLYDGVTMSDLEGFAEQHGLNARLVKTAGGLVEEVYRVGGRYSDEISAIVSHLRSAIPYAPIATRRALEALVRWYESGSDEDRAMYDIAWVADKDSLVDTVNGFIEVYLDARGVKGSWEAIVSYVNLEKTGALRRLAAEAAWFEARMPWDPRWRRTDVIGVTASAIDVVVETGDAGPLTAIGINLPNDQRIRERYGSKSVTLANITEAYEKAQLPAFRTEFCWDADEVERATRFGALASDVTTAIHEVLGHGSGQVADHLEGQPQLVLKETYSTLEETRADLVALHFLPDPKTAEVGLVPAEQQAEIVRTEYEAYARAALVQLRRVREGSTLEEDHMRNRQLVVYWLMEHTRAIDVRVREAKTYYVVVDIDEFRRGVAALLAEVQRIKSEGDYEAGVRLVATYGTTFEPGLRDEVVGRVDHLNLPSYTGFVQPRLDAVTNQAGRIEDVVISYPLDLEAQMLEYAGLR